MIALVLLALSRTSVTAQLHFAASNERAAYEDSGGALRWSFSDPTAVVLAGSAGLSDVTVDALNQGLAFTLGDGEADLSLALGGRPLAIDQIGRAILFLRSDGAVSAQLFVHDAKGKPLAGDIATHPSAGGGSLSLALPRPAVGNSSPVLRVHLSAAPKRRVWLRRLDLFPRQAPTARGCEASTNVEETIERCGAGPNVVQAPAALFPESLLTFRDGLRAGSLAIVRPHGDARFSERWVAAARNSAEFAWARVAIALVALLLLLLALRRRWRTTPVVSPWELAVFLPLAALLWLGFPAEGANTRASALAVWFGLAFLLTRPRLPWRWLGDRAAWVAIARFVLFALPVVALAACANAFDTDGFVARWPDLDKLWIYPLWALLQQFILIEIIGPRTRAAFGSDSTAALAAGAVFALLHLPNFSLMLATFIAGTAWAWFGYRHRALLPLLLSHVLLGLVVVIVAPPWLLRSAEIGGRYLMAP